MISVRVLVTGADGFIGTLLIEKLKQKKHMVTAFQGDVRDAENVKRNFEQAKPNAVIHLAAVLDETSKDLWSVNVQGTKNVLDNCKPDSRFVFPSSIGIFGESEYPIAENASYNPETEYEKTKMEAEKLVLASSTNYIILRTTIVYGPNQFWRQIFRAAQKDYPLIGNGANYFHLIFAYDFIDAIILALETRNRRQEYHLAGPDPRTYRETYQTICKTLSIPMTTKTIPEWKIKTIARFYEFYCKIAGKKPNVTMLPSSIDRLTRNRIVDTKKAELELGFKPHYTLEQGMRITAQQLGLTTNVAANQQPGQEQMPATQANLVVNLTKPLKPGSEKSIKSTKTYYSRTRLMTKHEQSRKQRSKHGKRAKRGDSGKHYKRNKPAKKPRAKPRKTTSAGKTTGIRWPVD